MNATNEGLVGDQSTDAKSREMKVRPSVSRGDVSDPDTNVTAVCIFQEKKQGEYISNIQNIKSMV